MSDDAISLLRSIDASLKVIAGEVLRRKSAGPKPVADDRDLNGKYGNPILKFTVRDWTGRSFKGRPFSDCPPELLDLVAESLDYFAIKSEEKDERTNNGKPIAPFRRSDAARARGWAKRIRDGKHVQTHEPADDTSDDLGVDDSFNDLESEWA